MAYYGLWEVRPSVDDATVSSRDRAHHVRVRVGFTGTPPGELSLSAASSVGDSECPGLRPATEFAAALARRGFNSTGPGPHGRLSWWPFHPWSHIKREGASRIFPPGGADRRVPWASCRSLRRHVQMRGSATGISPRRNAPLTPAVPPCAPLFTYLLERRDFLRSF